MCLCIRVICQHICIKHKREDGKNYGNQLCKSINQMVRKEPSHYVLLSQKYGYAKELVIMTRRTAWGAMLWKLAETRMWGSWQPPWASGAYGSVLVRQFQQAYHLNNREARREFDVHYLLTTNARSSSKPRSTSMYIWIGHFP